MNIFKDSIFSGKSILVTGASSGIGREAALALSRCGARIILAGRDEMRLTEVTHGLEGSGHIVAATSFETADQVCEWIKGVLETSGPLEGVFHCAGTEHVRPIRLTKQAHLNEVFRSSIFAGFGIARALSSAGAMNDGGSIVFMSSVASLTGQNGMSVYSAAKSGIDGMVRSLACEFSQRRIRVNSIAAGAIRTPMHDRLSRGSGEEAMTVYERSHLLGFGVVEDVAHAAVYLLSPASRWITGTTMVVDGGYTTR